MTLRTNYVDLDQGSGRVFAADMIAISTRLNGVPNVINVKDPLYGAVGDGTANDSVAIKAAQAAMTAGKTLYFPAGMYRFVQQNPANDAALFLNGLSNIGVYFEPGAELVMDNLNSGAGTSSGIIVYGSCSNVVIQNARVRWASTPSSRSDGDGFRFLGYPSDSAPPGGWTTTTGPVSNVQLLNCTTINAPATGAIFMGCSDIRVVNFRVDST